MSRPYDELVQSARDDRVLHFGPVRVHYRHIQGGRLNVSWCPICSGGLEGVMAEDAQAIKALGMAESARADAKRDAALASRSWEDPE